MLDHKTYHSARVWTAVFVHRCVGDVTFVTVDIVLGQEGSSGNLRNLLARLDPDTLVIDLSVNDLEALPDGPPEGPFHQGLLEALEEVAAEPPLQSYATGMDWAADNGAELRPIGPLPRQGWIQARRIKKQMRDASEAEEPETRARTAVQTAMKDDRIGPLADRHRQALAESLENVLAQEPPRTVALFAFPWGEMVSNDVRRSMGLRRVEGEALSGGWPA